MASSPQRFAVVLTRSWLAIGPLMTGIAIGVVAMAVTAIAVGYVDLVFPAALVAGWVVAHLVWRTSVGPERIVLLRPWGRRVVPWSTVVGADFVRERGSEEGRYILVAELANGRRLRLMTCARPPSERDTAGDDRTDRHVALVTAAMRAHGKRIGGLGSRPDTALGPLWTRHDLTPSSAPADTA